MLKKLYLTGRIAPVPARPLPPPPCPQQQGIERVPTSPCTEGMHHTPSAPPCSSHASNTMHPTRPHPNSHPKPSLTPTPGDTYRPTSYRVMQTRHTQKRTPILVSKTPGLEITTNIEVSARAYLTLRGIVPQALTGSQCNTCIHLSFTMKHVQPSGMRQVATGYRQAVTLYHTT